MYPTSQNMQTRLLSKPLAYVLGFSVTLFVIVIYGNVPNGLTKEVEKNHKDTVKHTNNNYKIILFWTSFFGHSDFYVGFGQNHFLNAKCRVNNCITTADRSHLRKSDAIIFHIRDFNKYDLPTQRSADQKYVFYLFESPGYTYTDLTHLNNFFNWTMTYRRDSDINLPYGFFLPINKSSNNETVSLSKEKMWKLGNKTKLVAWFVSNCNTHSNREQYVKELQKYIPVDVYGSCGQYSCIRESGPKDNCFEGVERDYKFYLSFENSLCQDYVTEKLYHALQYDVVPIVFGGGNYSVLAPPHSVIDASDFSGPAALAKFLWKLHFNLQNYATYFNWKSEFKIQTYVTHPWCQLCEKLNTDNQEKKYGDINAWWIDKGNCTSWKA